MKKLAALAMTTVVLGGLSLAQARTHRTQRLRFRRTASTREANPEPHPVRKAKKLRPGSPCVSLVAEIFAVKPPAKPSTATLRA